MQTKLPDDEPRFDLELLGFPGCAAATAAAAMAPAFGITRAEALRYVEEAPLLVVKGASEPVLCAYVRALHAAGADLKVRSRRGNTWVLPAPIRILAKGRNELDRSMLDATYDTSSVAPFAGEVPLEEGDTVPTWLLQQTSLPVIDYDESSGGWDAPPELDDADLPDLDDYGLGAPDTPVPAQPARAPEPARGAAPARVTMPPADAGTSAPAGRSPAAARGMRTEARVERVSGPAPPRPAPPAGVLRERTVVKPPQPTAPVKTATSARPAVPATGLPAARPTPRAPAPAAAAAPPDSSRPGTRMISATGTAKRQGKGPEDGPVRVYGVPETDADTNPWVDRIPTGEVFNQGLVLLRQERQKSDDPLEAMWRRTTSSFTAVPKKPKKR